ncbi:DUF3841 domain-containing protein [Acidaminobacter sp. JC074]|uniref:DUF3841 domain-containing protein n=1 Tax=Acidaminobacter sp. JC074 TaxID=2530199 RepID=UPI001F0ECDAD|nr:DUF3841 domain-containing protein [Acidaminobacter sp. JC074]MCH4890857.1 DUF3841 domain-containing protein [Acidaminobacter sp. JC074]
MDKVRVWTRQDKRILEVLDKQGHYRVDKSYILKRYEDCSDVYLDAYHWFSKEASKIVKRPEGCTYPIWLTVDPRIQINPIKGQVLLELEVDKKDLLVMDAAKWDHILNYWYIPKDSEDQKAYLADLEKRGIKDQSSIYTSNFYPLLKRRVLDSWKRLFDESNMLSTLTQGAIWEIKKEWIVKITRP